MLFEMQCCVVEIALPSLSQHFCDNVRRLGNKSSLFGQCDTFQIDVKQDGFNARDSKNQVAVSMQLSLRSTVSKLLLHGIPWKPMRSHSFEDEVRLLIVCSA